MDAKAFQQDKKAATQIYSRSLSAENLHNIEAEQELLGAILINNEAYHKVSEIINDEHFFDPLHSRIFRCAAKLINSGRLATPVTMKEYFEGSDPVGEYTVPQYLGILAINATSIINAPDYAETIKELCTRRDAVAAGENLIFNALDTAETPAKTAIEAAQDDLDRLTDHGGKKQNTCASFGDSVIKVIEQMKSPVRANTVTTGLHDLDKALGGGWPRGELTIAAARPSVGKSAFAVSTALKAAKQGNEVFLFSLEMNKEAVAARCLSELAYTSNNPIPYSGILSGNIEPHNWDRLDDMSREYNDLPLEIDDQRGLTITNIRSRLRRYINNLDRAGRKPDLVIIDHIGKIRAEEYQGQRHLELGSITENLAAISGDSQVAVLALCQLNRAVEGRENKRPGLGDLRESGRIEEDANLVLGLHRPGYYLERMKCDSMEEEQERLAELERVKNCFEASILKQRNGLCRPVELWCDMAANCFGNRGRG